MVEGRGYWRESDGSAISRETALRAWRKVAHLHLSALAGTYHATTTQDELAAYVQSQTGIHTSIPTGRWMNPLLSATAHLCRQLGEPPLTALVVQADGTVGPGYDDVLHLMGHSPIDDWQAREEHAARARLDCHRWAGVPEPVDGWQPQRPRPVPRPARPARQTKARAATMRATTPRRSAPPAPIPVCPTCFLALPATGVCGSCDEP